MDQSWEIIGIVIAVLMVVIGLRLLLRKPQPLPPVNAENLPIEETTQQPVVPRQIREGLLAKVAVADEVEESKAETPVTPPKADVAPVVAEETTPKQEESLKPEAEAKKNTAEDDLDELQAALLAEPDLVEEAKALNKTEEDKTAQNKTEQKQSTDQDDEDLLDQDDEKNTVKPDIQSLQLPDDDWENETTVFDAHLSAQDRTDEESALATAQKIVALYVYPSPERALSGERALKIMLKYGLRFGELSCFHRYEHAEQVSPLMFSVLRVHEDGTPTGFDLEMLPTEEVKGLAFFLALPNPNAVQGFDMMASLAGLIARDIDGLVFDEQSLELTQQLKDHWRHYVVEYDPNQPHE